MLHEPELPTVQRDWRFCTKCGVMFFDGFPGKGVCPAGGSHEAAGFAYGIEHDRPLIPTTQDDWRFCSKCGELFFDGLPGKGVCPAGGGHLRAKDSLNYFLVHSAEVPGPTLTVHIKLLTNPTQFSVDEMFTEMRNIYSRVGIDVVHGSTETLNKDLPDITTLNDIDTGSCVRGNPSDEQIALSNFRNEAATNDIVVYMCRSVSQDSGSLNGCASSPAGRPMAVVASYATLYTMAHEVGHVLGLEHVDDNNRLMTGNGTAGITNPPPDLIQTEVETMLSSNLTV
ncbi:hypothetical protein [Spirosoma sp. KNUC1025]|uniref:hypothetical protein n=1 Tax=Spirosoma sp. KNUC1025 TaxID=2894082 RepID=UPI003866564D|nr:matrixin family metalloprotease [Spirosoma sp. KNUC1025]